MEENVESLRKPSYKAFLRDKEHDCRLAKFIEINNDVFMPIMSHRYGVILLNKKYEIKEMSWSEWDKCKKKNTEKIFPWSIKIHRIIKKEKKRLSKQFKKNIKRTPVIKRTPMIRRTPIMGG